jgi:hypothetical protein
MRKSLEGKLHVRRGAGVVERDGFEIRCTCKGTQGSNPCLSATCIVYMIIFIV